MDETKWDVMDEWHWCELCGDDVLAQHPVRWEEPDTLWLECEHGTFEHWSNENDSCWCEK